jgi:hypothetical protein
LHICGTHWDGNEYVPGDEARWTRNTPSRVPSPIASERDTASKKTAPLEHYKNDRRTKIELRAHELYVQRGCIDGHDIDDWLTAEREVLEWIKAKAQSASDSTSTPAKPEQNLFL